MRQTFLAPLIPLIPWKLIQHLLRCLIKLTLDRNTLDRNGDQVTLIPGDSYMVDISVTDRAGNPATETYDMQMFTMLRKTEHMRN